MGACGEVSGAAAVVDGGRITPSPVEPGAEMLSLRSPPGPLQFTVVSSGLVGELTMGALEVSSEEAVGRLLPEVSVPPGRLWLPLVCPGRLWLSLSDVWPGRVWLPLSAVWPGRL